MSEVPLIPFVVRLLFVSVRARPQATARARARGDNLYTIKLKQKLAHLSGK